MNGWEFTPNHTGCGTDYVARNRGNAKPRGQPPPADTIYFARDERCRQRSSQPPLPIRFNDGHQLPVNAFWSITLYKSNETFADNSLGRHAIHNPDGLCKEGDGRSLSVCSVRRRAARANQIGFPRRPIPSRWSFDCTGHRRPSSRVRGVRRRSSERVARLPPELVLRALRGCPCWTVGRKPDHVRHSDPRTIDADRDTRQRLISVGLGQGTPLGGASNDPRQVLWPHTSRILTKSLDAAARRQLARAPEPREVTWCNGVLAEVKARMAARCDFPCHSPQSLSRPFRPAPRNAP